MMMARPYERANGNDRAENAEGNGGAAEVKASLAIVKNKMQLSIEPSAKQ